MKNVSEAMGLRNALLDNFERALTCATDKERQELLNVVIVGGGATGVEIVSTERNEELRIAQRLSRPPYFIDEHLLDRGRAMLISCHEQ